MKPEALVASLGTASISKSHWIDQEVTLGLSDKPLMQIERKPRQAAGQDKSSDKINANEREKAEVANQETVEDIPAEKLKMQGVQPLMKQAKRSPVQSCRVPSPPSGPRVSLLVNPEDLYQSILLEI